MTHRKISRIFNSIAALKHPIGSSTLLLAIVLALCLGRVSFAQQAAVPPTEMSTGLLPVGVQPHGSLTGKIIYVHGGHGYTAENKGKGNWSFQRGVGHRMVEDLGNYDQMTLFVDYLFRAGATVVPLRPVGHQVHEIVMDNDDRAVTFEGKWSDGQEGIYFGKPGGVAYRQAATSQKETAIARYRPKILESGFYPVYAWTSSGGDRAADQLYRIHHAGGATEVTVNHRRVGNGLVYLGTYYFEAGTDGFVEISNRSNSPDSFVVADMIRFGNGMGDIDRGGGVSGLAREDESGLYWVKWHADRSQGVAESAYRATDVDRQAAVSFSPRYAAFMNRESDGRLKDRVFVSFHSNAGSGKARGVLGLLNGNNDRTTATPNQLLLAKSLAQEVNDEMVAQNGKFEHDWYDRKQKTTLDRVDIEFGEINNHYINDEFDATIVEVAFHDNQEDAELLRDPKARDALARATYHGLLKYFRAVDNNETSTTKLPATPIGIHVSVGGPGRATVSWKMPEANPQLGDAASGFRVYASLNGYGFDAGTPASGSKSTSITLKNLLPQRTYYFKVAATNDGGESAPSDVVAVVPGGTAKDILVVNGFHRQDRALDPKQRLGGGATEVDRVRPKNSNSGDYVVQVARAIEAVRPGARIESTCNEAVIEGAVELAKYRSVIWLLGRESSKDRTLDEAEQESVEKFVAGGGNLFISGSEIGWDLGHENHGRDFLEKTLGTNFVADNANSYAVQGANGSIFSALPAVALDDGAKCYDVASPDVVAPAGSAQVALNYANTNKVAGLQINGKDGRGNVVVFAFPFETIARSADQREIMKRILDYFHPKK